MANNGWLEAVMWPTQVVSVSSVTGEDSQKVVGSVGGGGW